MSFHPFVSRWNLAMPSTIAGVSVGAYSLTVTVWCTNAACTTPKRGAARGGTAAAPHAARGTIRGGLPRRAPPPRGRRGGRRAAGGPPPRLRGATRRPRRAGAGHRGTADGGAGDG